MPPYADDDYSSDEEGSNYSDWTPTGDYIAVPDGPCTNPHDLADFYTSRVGGPVTPLASVPLPQHPQCAACDRPLYLLAQVHAPVGNMDHRVMYVFGCNRRQCMARPGSFVALRAVSLVGPPLLVGGEGDEDEVELTEQAQGSQDVVFGMGETGGSNEFGGFGSSVGADTDDPFGGFGGDAFTAGFSTGVSQDTNGPSEAAFAFSTGSSDQLQFNLTPSATSATKASSAKPKAEKAHQLPAKTTKSLEDAMDALSLSAATGTDTPPAFPAFYLSIEEEYVQSKHAKAAAYSHYRPGDGSLGDDDAADEGNMGRKAAAAAANGPSGWDTSAEVSESTNIKGLTRHLERFVDRVEDNPSQVIRYNHGGTPLMYSEHHVLHVPAQEAQDMAKTSASGKAKGKPSAEPARPQRLPACPRCGSRRVYECQLMPTILSVLPVEKHAPEPTPAEVEAMGKNPAMWVRGMEFGTVLVFTCGQNCIAQATEQEVAAGAMYVPEVCLVQLEQE